jgi:hypothetical protein
MRLLLVVYFVFAGFDSVMFSDKVKGAGGDEFFSDLMMTRK